jgi:hypothetical protein
VAVHSTCRSCTGIAGCCGGSGASGIVGSLASELWVVSSIAGGWHSSRFEVQASALLPKSLDIPEQLADLGTAGGTCQSAAGGSCL